MSNFNPEYESGMKLDNQKHKHRYEKKLSYSISYSYSLKIHKIIYFERPTVLVCLLSFGH